MSPTYSPRDAAAHIGIAPVTLRKWSTQFRSVLSPQAQTPTAIPGGRIERRYTADDIETLRQLGVFLDSGMTYTEALIAFASRPVPDPDEPASPTAETDLPPEPAEPSVAPAAAAPAAAAPIPDIAEPEPPPAAAPPFDPARLLAAFQTAYVTALAAKDETIAAQARTIAALQDDLDRLRAATHPHTRPRRPARSGLRAVWRDLVQWMHQTAM